MEGSRGFLVVLAVLCGILFSAVTAKSRSKRAVVCTEGWETYADGLSCYKYYNTSVNQAAAQSACIAAGANLASVTGQAEHDFLLANVWPNVQNTYVYIGGSDETTEGTWTWSDGTAWSFTKWGRWNRQQLPVHGTDHNCLTMTSVTDTIGDWYDYKCSDTAGYLCEKAATETSLSCTKGIHWKLHGSNCYFLVRGMKTWNSARTNCIKMGAQLASIHDQATNDFFTNKWINPSGRGLWIGANDQVTEGTFLWTDGSNKVYDNWAVLNGVQQPENTTLKNCVGLESPRRNLAGKWNDYKCTMKTWSVCQTTASGR